MLRCCSKIVISYSKAAPKPAYLLLQSCSRTLGPASTPVIIQTSESLAQYLSLCVLVCFLLLQKPSGVPLTRLLHASALLRFQEVASISAMLRLCGGDVVEAHLETFSFSLWTAFSQEVLDGWHMLEMFTHCLVLSNTVPRNRFFRKVLTKIYWCSSFLKDHPVCLV